MKKHVHEFWEEGDNKENNKKEERSFEKSNKQIYGCKKNCIMASMAVGSDDEQSYDDE